MALLTGKPVLKEERFDATHLPRRVRPNKPFFLAHLPQRWEPVPTKVDKKTGVVQSVEWLPQLGPVPIDPGVNGVTKIGRAPANPEPAIAHWQSRGGVVLRHGDPRLGKWKNYMSEFPSAWKGAPVFRDMFTQIEVLGDMVEEEVDAEEYNAFRRHLVKEHFVQPINVMVVRKSLARWEARLDRNLNKLSANNSNALLQRRVAEAEGWVNAIRESLESLESGRKPAGKPVKMRGKASAPKLPEA